LSQLLIIHAVGVTDMVQAGLMIAIEPKSGMPQLWKSYSL